MMIVPLNTKGVSNDGHFYGYASVFHVMDYDGDVLLPGAFKESLEAWAKKDQKPNMLWQHAPEVTLGAWHNIAEDAYGLVVKGQLDLTQLAAKHVWQLIHTGEIKGLSIGFHTLSAVFHKGCRYIKRVDLCEISIVTEACNRMACISPFMH